MKLLYFRLVVLFCLSWTPFLLAGDEREPDWSKVHVSLGGSFVPVTTYFAHRACIQSVRAQEGGADYAYFFLSYLYPKSTPFASADEVQKFLDTLDKLVYERLPAVGKERASAVSKQALNWEYSFLEKLFEEYERFQSDFLRTISSFGALNDEKLRWEKTYLEVHGTCDLGVIANLIFQLHDKLHTYNEIRGRITGASSAPREVPPLEVFPEPVRIAIERKLKLTEERKHAEPIWKTYDSFVAKAEEISAWELEALFETGEDLAAIRKEVLELEKQKAELGSQLLKLLADNGNPNKQYVAIEVRPMRGSSRANSNETLRDSLIEMYHQLARKKNWSFRKVDGSTIVISGPRAFDYLAGETGKHTLNGKLGPETRNYNHTAFVTAVEISRETSDIDAYRLLSVSRNDDKSNRAYAFSAVGKPIRNSGLDTEVFHQVFHADEVMAGGQTEAFFEALLLQSAINNLNSNEG
ncbi:MAG: PCRF domain-containing protein [Bdellovibrionaceae bacterium]|nr:PCRF domain-containing protein [Bdellovibrionales bacterium]MCB9255420.1 PCRF domain-containing protein [Pseudobdellovibrionaceae bacterium]